MLSFDEIKATAQDGARYWAIGENGRKYSATFSAEHFGGVMFFCIPDDIKIIGYEQRDIKTFTANINGDFTPAALMEKYAKQNSGTIELTRHLGTRLIIDGRKYEYDHYEKSEDGERVTVTLAEID